MGDSATLNVMVLGLIVLVAGAALPLTRSAKVGLMVVGMAVLVVGFVAGSSSPASALPRGGPTTTTTEPSTTTSEPSTTTTEPYSPTLNDCGYAGAWTVSNLDGTAELPPELVPFFTYMAGQVNEPPTWCSFVLMAGAQQASTGFIVSAVESGGGGGGGDGISTDTQRAMLAGLGCLVFVGGIYMVRGMVG